MYDLVVVDGKALSKPEIRQKIIELEYRLKQAFASGELTDLTKDLEVENLFIPGGYLRKLTIPQHAVIVGKTHTVPAFNLVLKGKICVITESGMKTFEAGDTFVSQTGIKKVGYTFEETIWANIFVTEKTDVDDIIDSVSINDVETVELLEELF